MNADDLTRIQRRVQMWGRHFNKHVSDITDLDPETADMDVNDLLLALDSILDFAARIQARVQEEIVKLEVL